MARAILELIPVMIGAAVTPVCIVVVLLLLRSEDGLPKALAFACGQILVRLVQGIGFGSEMKYSSLAHSAQGAAGIINTLILLGGILMWITALKSWTKQEDPDAPPPRWMARVSSFSRLKAFGLGLVTTAGTGKQWIFTFYALSLVRAAGLPDAQSAVTFLVFIVGAQFLILLPIGLCAFAPQRSSPILGTATLWLEHNTQTIIIIASIAFGTFFVFKGVTGLLR